MSSRRFLFAALYFSEGAPIGYIWWALPTKLRAAGVPVERITTLTAILILPWAFKFLWAPLVDAFPVSRFGVRGWIVIAQSCMGAALIPLMFVDPGKHLAWFSAILLVHSFAAATQDAAVDAHAVASVQTAERGGINAWMQVGMLTGRSVFGGVALYVEARVGHVPVLLALLVCVWSTMLLVLRTSGSSDQPPKLDSGIRFQVFVHTLRQATSRRSTWFGLLFAIFGGASYEAVGAVAGPMLIDSGASPETVGLFFAAPAVVCMGIGALIGGRIGDRLGRTAAVRGFMFAIVVTTVSIAIIHALACPLYTLVAVLAIFYLFVGGFAASSYALFMEVTDTRLGATQFSAFMGATNLCEAWSALGIGHLVTTLDYPFALCVMTVPTLLTTRIVHRLHSNNEPTKRAAFTFPSSG